MMISVSGIGWVTKRGFGSLRLGLDHQFTAEEGVRSLVKLGIFTHPLKNFGRLDEMSRITVSAVALALQDAGIEYSPAYKQDIGIIAANREGSLKSDIDYFNDFIDNGRTLSRANLFIYTLPSSAPGEAAIHFGLTGPLLYVTEVTDSLLVFLDMATEMVHREEAARMLLGTVVAEEALYLVIERNKEEGSALCNLDEARSILACTQNISEIICQLSNLKLKKGIS